MNKILIEQSHNCKTFDADVGDTIAIVLKENPTTGYRWKVDQDDEEIILLTGSEYSKIAKNGIGGGGTRTFIFEARSPGKRKIHLSLKREWEKKLNPIDQFQVFIHIR